ncbi:aprataxin and PNK-like factor isoform X3 [Phyllostomus discolor]|uniref:Aprataxin and PNK-like factor n=1 Tax=Phyllostomus discolor TaxID=89673 RepID=A0A6J2M0U2_9CHIR|nr:aprataxin and PNK-like factor isoform X3 [Phyllostomus discolor]
MSRVFELQPQDGGAPVALEPGETVIGRGPLLGITDKKVSRRHAILEVVGSQLRIKPIHTSPCFYQSSEKSQFLPLKTNLWHWLNPGDSFSLLVDKYIFRVFSTYSETELESTLRNSQMLDADDMLNETPESPLVKLPDEKGGAPQLERSAEVATAQTSTTKSASFLGECSDFSKQQLNPAQRKRILPAWMLTENLDNVIRESGRGVCKDKTQVNITQQGRKRLISPGSSESTSAEQDTGKKYKNTDQEESIISSKQMPQSLSAITLSNTDTNNMKTYAQRNKTPTEELGKVPEHKSITKGTLRKGEAVSRSESCSSAQGLSCHSESQGSHPECSSGPADPETLHAKAADSVLQGSEENKVKRTSCMYGANCYRKNPVHFQHFSHPGDSDYGRVEATCQDEADDRPECPYGESCYRKNPQHKIEYKHSTLPGRSIVEEDDGQPSEQDLNDSFIDDEEEEYEPTDEDSDWEPGKDEEKEDVEELLKEAKTFMKRKK